MASKKPNRRALEDHLPAVLAAALALLLGCGAREPAASPPPQGPPDLAELRTLLTSGAQRHFSPEDVDRGCPADQTVGEYVALLEANTRPDPADPSAIVSLAGGCAAGVPTSRHGASDALWPPPDATRWLCHVDAYASDAAGESPWHYELRVMVRRDDRSIDPTWWACPGLP